MRTVKYLVATAVILVANVCRGDAQADADSARSAASTQGAAEFTASALAYQEYSAAKQAEAACLAKGATEAQLLPGRGDLGTSNGFYAYGQAEDALGSEDMTAGFNLYSQAQMMQRMNNWTWSYIYFNNAKTKFDNAKSHYLSSTAYFINSRGWRTDANNKFMALLGTLP